MNSLIEIIIIAVFGIGAIVFIVLYFYRLSRQRGCGSCPYYKEKNKKRDKDDKLT